LNPPVSTLPTPNTTAPTLPLYLFANHFHNLGGLRYHYLDEGHGEPLVMLHGNPISLMTPAMSIRCDSASMILRCCSII
jgi:hypothetical protein